MRCTAGVLSVCCAFIYLCFSLCDLGQLLHTLGIGREGQVSIRAKCIGTDAPVPCDIGVSITHLVRMEKSKSHVCGVSCAHLLPSDRYGPNASRGVQKDALQDHCMTRRQAAYLGFVDEGGTVEGRGVQKGAIVHQPRRTSGPRSMIHAAHQQQRTPTTFDSLQLHICCSCPRTVLP